MKDKILSLFTNPSEMTPEQIVLNIGIAAVLGFFIFISYYISPVSYTHLRAHET